MTIKIVIAAFAGLVVGASCSDRPVSNDAPPEQTEEQGLCQKNCKRQIRCAVEHDGFVEDANTEDDCIETCMENWFSAERAACRDVAIRGLTCESQAICDQEAERPASGGLAVCDREKYPYSGCIADPQYWAESGCTYDTCLSGECCNDAPPPS